MKSMRPLALLVVCLLLVQGLMLAEAAPRSRFRGDTPPPDVPRGDRASESCFEDAVFIGDSLMAGLELHGVFPDSLYAAAVGISPHTALGRVFDTNTGKKTLKEILSAADFSKVYVLMGANAVDNAGSGAAAARYARFLDKLVSAYPDKLVYVLSIPPRASRGMTEIIGGFNRVLRKICGERGIYYLDLFSRMLDSEGLALRQYLAMDGIHLSRQGSDFVRDFIMSHTVKEGP